MGYDGEIKFDTNIDTKNFSDGLGKLGSIAEKGMSLVTNAINSAIGTISEFAKSSVDVGMNFDSSMSQVAATMGKTAEEITELRDFAKEMGSKTAFSATQSADALNYMALAGYTAEQSMQALPNVLNLAAAGGIDLARASDMVTDAQSALGLSMDESTELIDKMAKASSKSNTSVAQLGDAILTIGGTAKNLKGGTTELATSLGILADNGIKGSEGGTALRNMILSLSAPTDKAAAQMEALGLKVFDADGNMRPLNETFADLDSILADMNQGEKTETLNAIFNKVDLKSVEAMLANSGERFNELSGYIDDAKGAAEQMAETQLDNLAGDVTLFKSALEGVQVAVSDKLSPTIRGFVQLASQDLSQLTTALSNGASFDVIFEEVVKSLEGIGLRLKEVITEIAPDIVEAAFNIIQFLADGLKNRIKFISDVAPDLLKAISDGVSKNLPSLISSAVEIVTFLANAIFNNTNEIIKTALSIIQVLVDSISNNLPTLISAALNIIITISDAIFSNFDMLIDIAIELVMLIADTLIDNLDDLIDAAVKIVMSIVNAISKNVGKLVDAAIKIISSLTKGLIDNLPLILKATFQIIAAIVAGIIQAAPELFKLITEINQTIVNEIKNTDWLVLGLEIMLGIGNGVRDGISGVMEWFSYFFDEMDYWTKNELPVIINGIIDWFKKLPDKIYNGIKSTIDKVKEWGINVVNKGKESAKEFVESVIKKVKEIPDKTYNGIKNTVDKVKEWGINLVNQGREIASELVESITNKVRELPDKLYNLGYDIVTGLWNGINDMGAWLSDKISSFGDNVLNSLKDFFGIHSPSRLMRDQIGKNLALGIGVGFENTMPEVAADAISAFDVLTNTAKSMSSYIPVNSYFSNITNSSSSNTYSEIKNENTFNIYESRNAQKTAQRISEELAFLKRSEAAARGK